MDYDPDETRWSPSSWLGAYASSIWNEYLDYWELQNIPEDSELTDEQRALFRRMHEMAEALRPCLHTLSPSAEFSDRLRDFLVELGASNTPVDDDFAAEVATIINEQPIIRDAIKCDLALEATDTLLARAEERAATLVALVANRALSERASAYLDRATRLYLWGFDPETIVMCAAVIEAAYEGRFSDTQMFAWQIKKDGKEYGPNEYEHAAELAGVFSRGQRTAAAAIRRARNDTLHNVPNSALSAKESLRTTAELLQRLFPKTGQ